MQRSIGYAQKSMRAISQRRKPKKFSSAVRRALQLVHQAPTGKHFRETHAKMCPWAAAGDCAVLNVAITVCDRQRAAETVTEIEAATQRAGLSLRAVQWDRAAGLPGQFVTSLRLVLRIAVCVSLVIILIVLHHALMAAMLARLPEIGVLRAIGAQPGFIVFLLSFEALQVGLLFGAAGCSFGVGDFTCLLRCRKPGSLHPGPRLVPSPAWSGVFAAFGIVLVTTLASWLHPASEPELGSVLQIVQAHLSAVTAPDAIIVFEEQARKLGLHLGDVVTLVADTPQGVANTLECSVVAIARDLGVLGRRNVIIANDTLRSLYQYDRATIGVVQVWLQDRSPEEIVVAAERLRLALRRAGYSVMSADARAFSLKYEAISQEDWTGQRLDVTTVHDELSFITWTLKVRSKRRVAPRSNVTSTPDASCTMVRTVSS